MSTAALVFVIIGAASVTGWILEVIDAIEMPAKKKNKS